jgi:hypothetical protein
MCSRQRLLAAGLLLFAALLAGCSKQPPGMKNQPTGIKSGAPKITLPSGKVVDPGD